MNPVRAALPIDKELPGIVAALRDHQALVIEAPPGAGKTTRVPLALLEADFAAGRPIVVSEPRRLAAKLAAHFVASELGESVGRRVGYQVRFDSHVGRETRVRYVTAGVLLRQLLPAPPPGPSPDPDRDAAPNMAPNMTEPSDLGIVILDEFHERQIENDQVLALLKARMRNDPRLRLIVMSATLDGENVAAFLDHCPRVRSEGRAFPLHIEHEVQPDDRPLDKRVSSAVKRALKEQTGGHALVFLPTVRDIALAQTALAQVQAQGVEVMPLHGEMSLPDQARAVSDSAQRKVVLATNVAESSVTVPGVTMVIDTGLARIAVDSPWSGLRELTVSEISQASATQRAGRAGRVAPGVVVRLFSEQNFRARRQQDIPEIQRSELSEAWLMLIGSGIARPEELPWLDAPPQASCDAARTLLLALGALSPAGELSSIGRRMLRFSIHPRLARVIVAGEDLGIARHACLAAVLLSERDIVQRQSQGGLPGANSDLLARCDLFHEAQAENFSERSLRALSLSRAAVQAVQRSTAALSRAAHDRGPSPADEDSALCQALLTGFPDRVARRRNLNSSDLVLVNGTTARLSPHSVVQHASLLVAHDVERRADQQGRSSMPWVTLATRVEPDWLLDFYADSLRHDSQLNWNTDKETVEQISQICYGSIVLEETRSRAPASEQASLLLARAAAQQRARFSTSAGSGETFLARVALLSQYRPDLGLPAPHNDASSALLDTACQGRTSFQELDALDWSTFFESSLQPNQRSALERELPLTLTLPSGHRVKVSYERDKTPWASSRLQDFFGLREGPRLCNGKLPVTLHLLAPNQRAVQITTDLSGFWQRHYPALRKELMRRYPRHAWPEDPVNAEPPERTR